MTTDQRLTAMEIKLSYTEDLLDGLNLAIYRQQQQIDALIRELASMRRQAAEAGAALQDPQNDIPPHY